MNYILKPSLKGIAGVKLATILWNQSDIRNAISTSSDSLLENDESWSEIEDKVQEKVPLLLLPENLKQELSIVIKPIGIQILKWIQYHKKNHIELPLPQEFCWTSYGIIDRISTAQMLLKDESIDIIMRFNLSSIYCFEDSIVDIWSKLPEESRIHVEDESPSELVVIWARIMRRADTKKEFHVVDIFGNKKLSTEIPYMWAFKFAATDGNAEASRYILHKVSANYKKLFAIETARFVFFSFVILSWDDFQHNRGFLGCNYFKGVYGSEILVLFLSEMNCNQQKQLFQEAPVEVLTCLLEWPWHFFFMQTMNAIGDVLSKKSYNAVFNAIIDKVIGGHKYFNFLEAFEEMWKQSPRAVKKYIFKKSCHPRKNVIAKLFQLKEKGNIKRILSDATLKERKTIIYSDCGRDFCNDLIHSEEWDFLEYFIRECIASKRGMTQFKKHVQEIIGSWSKEAIDENVDKVHKCFQLLDDILSGFDKRKCVEETDANQAKRLNSSDSC